MWKVSIDDLNNIEYFYGKDCSKEIVNVKLYDVNYFVLKDEKIEGAKIVEEYTVEDGKQFNNIAYEERKQEKYLNISYKYTIEEDLLDKK